MKAYIGTSTYSISNNFSDDVFFLFPNILIALFCEFLLNDTYINSVFIEKLLNFDILYNVDILSQNLYNEFYVVFLISGLILLAAMIGCIILTLKLTNTQFVENPHKQITILKNRISFF